MTEIIFSAGRNKEHAHGLNVVRLPFPEFARHVLTSAATLTAKDGPFVCGPLRDGRRNAEAVLPVAFAALDLDRVRDEIDMGRIVEASEAWQGFGYTTASHKPEAGIYKMRLFFALDREVSRDEYRRLCRGIAARLQALADAPVEIDDACSKPEQPLYTARAGAMTWQFDGELMPVDAVLSEVHDGEPVRQQQPTGSAADWLTQLLAGDDVHGNAARVVGRMVASGMDDATIRATMTVLSERVGEMRGTARAQALLGSELTRLIQGARRKGYGTAQEPQFDGEVDLLRADQVKVEPIAWQWDGYLAGGKLHIAAGAPGGGKTTIALALAAVKTTGGRWPDGTRASVGNVLLWSGEDDPGDTLVPRLMAMGADLSRIAFVDGASEIVNGIKRRVAFDPARHLDALASSIADAPPALLIVDPIVSAVAGDSHKNAEVRRGLQPLVDMARLHGIAVLGITHFSKGTQGRDPTERVTGSLAFGALARIVFVASKTREGGRVFMKSKANITTDEGGFEYDVEQVEVPGLPGVFASRIVWGAMVQGNAREVLADAEAEPTQGEAPEPTATHEATEALREVLTPGETVGRDVITTMKAAGFTEKVVRLAREQLGVTIRRDGFGKDMKSLWALPDAHSCPDSPFMPSFSNSETGARMEGEGTNGADCTSAEVF
ncbi:ATP-binding protein [Quisquiliibacterium transsilvanicum]|uniref:AAA+ ATPase domain-containing protein n=1 Tax=Quisquiliibacterium transsilvanicum TaxID=1549638 RepID=A0A7W8M8P6_9BURK|nr:AAA family ATPase [Quisquiliibacterium transsilvanicum]MBB5272231.1 hypothetical protein [Quisquiliibacterium transsilvanicum]